MLRPRRIGEASTRWPFLRLIRCREFAWSAVSTGRPDTVRRRRSATFYNRAHWPAIPAKLRLPFPPALRESALEGSFQATGAPALTRWLCCASASCELPEDPRDRRRAASI